MPHLRKPVVFVVVPLNLTHELDRAAPKLSRKSEQHGPRAVNLFLNAMRNIDAGYQLVSCSQTGTPVPIHPRPVRVLEIGAIFAAIKVELNPGIYDELEHHGRNLGLTHMIDIMATVGTFYCERVGKFNAGWQLEIVKPFGEIEPLPL